LEGCRQRVPDDCTGDWEVFGAECHLCSRYPMRLAALMELVCVEW